MMKNRHKYTLWISLLLLCCACNTTKSVVQPHYVEGVLTIKLQENYPLTFNVKEDKTVALEELVFLKDLIKPYGIQGASRPFELFDDPDLLRTIQISFSNIKKTDLLIEKLKKNSAIEYVEKIPIKQKKGVKK